MILLDTNVISEALKPNGALAVSAWIDDQAIETLYLSTITLAELRFSIAVMANARTTCGNNWMNELCRFSSGVSCRSMPTVPILMQYYAPALVRLVRASIRQMLISQPSLLHTILPLPREIPALSRLPVSKSSIPGSYSNSSDAVRHEPHPGDIPTWERSTMPHWNEAVAKKPW